MGGSAAVMGPRNGVSRCATEEQHPPWNGSAVSSAGRGIGWQGGNGEIAGQGNAR